MALPAECTVLGVLHKNATRKKVPCWWKSQKKAHTTREEREEETLNNYTPFDVSPLLFLIMLTSYLVCNLCCLTNSSVPNSKGIENTISNTLIFFLSRKDSYNQSFQIIFSMFEHNWACPHQPNQFHKTQLKVKLTLRWPTVLAVLGERERERCDSNQFIASVSLQ